MLKLPEGFDFSNLEDQQNLISCQRALKQKLFPKVKKVPIF